MLSLERSSHFDSVSVSPCLSCVAVRKRPFPTACLLRPSPTGPRRSSRSRKNVRCSSCSNSLDTVAFCAVKISGGEDRSVTCVPGHSEITVSRAGSLQDLVQGSFPSRFRDGALTLHRVAQSCGLDRLKSSVVSPYSVLPYSDPFDKQRGRARWMDPPKSQVELGERIYALSVCPHRQSCVVRTYDSTAGRYIWSTCVLAYPSIGLRHSSRKG